MKPDKEHVLRVKKELIEAGVTSYGRKKASFRHLSDYIHEDEHIGAVVYGQYEGGSGMLAATDHRIIFFDRKPLFATTDELTYDIVAGIKLSKGGFFNTVTLHTRIADYTIRYANAKCAKKFVKYIESMRLHKTNLQERIISKNAKAHETKAQSKPRRKSVQPHVSEPVMPVATDALTFLRTHDLGVLSTVGRNGSIHGTPMYYVLGESGEYLYIVTKQATNKARNILAGGSVGFTVYDEEALQTLHIQANAELETDQVVKDQVYGEIVKPREYSGRARLPPVAHMIGGVYLVIRLSIVSTTFADYSAKA